MAANAELWMPFDDVYQHVLSIPVHDCQKFAVHPLAWLRYLAFTIFGKEGYISSSPNGSEIDYYKATIPPGFYYYVSQGSLLLDPDMDDRTSDASQNTTRRSHFQQEVKDRDHGTCVMTGSSNVTACHVIPHAKGNQAKYMINLAYHRLEHLDPPLDSIDDARNGILLAVHLHHPFGASQVAFLPTPNFAMTVNDVDLVIQPNAASLGYNVQPENASSRLTLQHFNSHDTVVDIIAPHNSDARQSSSDEWPPPLIFDVAYGCAGLRTWGAPAFMEFARRHTRNIYYNYLDSNDNENGAGGGGRDNGNGSGGVLHSGVSSAACDERISKQNCERDDRDKKWAGRFAGGQASSTADSQADIADMVLGLWAQNARKAQCEAHAVKAGRIEEKVRTWLDSVR